MINFLKLDQISSFQFTGDSCEDGGVESLVHSKETTINDSQLHFIVDAREVLGDKIESIELLELALSSLEEDWCSPPTSMAYHTV